MGISSEKSWKMFLLLNEHCLNPDVFINIKQFSKLWIQDIFGQTTGVSISFWLLTSLTCLVLLVTIRHDVSKYGKCHERKKRNFNDLVCLWSSKYKHLAIRISITLKLGSGVKEEYVSPADQLHPQCAYCQDHENWKIL